MPYVDEGQSREPMNLPPVVPILATALAMAASIGLYWAFYEYLGLNQWLAPLLAGILIGCALRFSSARPLPRSGAIAIAATLVTCLVGYVVRHVLWIKWVDPTFKPTVGHAFEYLFSADLFTSLFMAMGAYFAFTIAAAIPRSTATEAGAAA